MVAFLVYAILFLGYWIGGYWYGVWTTRRQQRQTNAGMIVAHLKLAPCRRCNGLGEDCPGCLGHGYIPEEQLGVIANNPSIDLRKLEDLFDSLKNQHRYGK
jgi:hypothetical protein